MLNQCRLLKTWSWTESGLASAFLLQLIIISTYLLFLIKKYDFYLDITTDHTYIYYTYTLSYFELNVSQVSFVFELFIIEIRNFTSHKFVLLIATINEIDGKVDNYRLIVKVLKS